MLYLICAPGPKAPAPPVMIAMPKLIPASVWSALSLSIAKGDTAGVKRLVEEYHLDVNAFVDSRSWMPVLMEALLSYGFETRTTVFPCCAICWRKAPTRIFAAIGDIIVCISPCNRKNM